MSIVYLADFLKTSLTKFAVILVKSCRKAGFLNPRSSKITVTKEKERAGNRKGGEEKKAMVALLVFHLGVFTPKKLLDAKRSFSLAITFSKMLSYGSQ